MNQATIARHRDILDLPHPVSLRHGHLPRESRAAQFAPFAALTGYEALMQTATEETRNNMNRQDTEEFWDI